MSLVPITLDTDQQTIQLDGGEYIVSTFLNGGSASLDVINEGGSAWSPVGTLTDSPQRMFIQRGASVRLTKTGGALVEINR
ncbi:hypothetical protein [Alteromonas phage PB15]|nr:hypothetical protein [Alteromonas phage PB15]